MQETYFCPNVFEGRVRTYRPQRARARARIEDKATANCLRAGQKAMEAEVAPDLRNLEPKGTGARDQTVGEPIDRATLCLPDYDSDRIVHQGDVGFKDALRQYFPVTESDATERLVNLKSALRNASTHDFWALLMEEMCAITGAQCAFVAKRMLVDDQDSAVEMPPLGEPGSCLMGVAFYINTATEKHLYRDYRYHAYGTPCAHMRHDKVFIIPERVTEVCPNNPNASNLPFQSEAFIGAPLFAEGKSFAHFCLIWSSEGAQKRSLSWSYLEMFMHSLEELITQRLLERRGFTKDTTDPNSTPAKIIPLAAITASQSLKPYARSLSHELRTPMQGVIGMLDIMYSTVLDAIATQDNLVVRSVFTDLKGHIEVVQDSSKRAVEAADNVVHAYDLNMQMPETPLSSEDDLESVESEMDSMATDKYGLRRTSTKRKLSESSISNTRHSSDAVGFHPGPPLKKMFTVTEAEYSPKLHHQPPTPTSAGGPRANGPDFSPECYFDMGSSPTRASPVLMPADVGPTRRRIVIRDFMRELVHTALKSGHPTSEVHVETALGETIEVQTQGPRGETNNRLINLSIEDEVPIAMVTEEQHLKFSLQKVVDNALKFTESGSITITVKMGRNSLAEIWVVDTGCGITEESRSHLFTPHFQEDASISRSRDGLGLSLFNAKAHVRRNLGGDVTLERSATEGDQKGSSFLIRLPIPSDPADASPLNDTASLYHSDKDCNGSDKSISSANSLTLTTTATTTQSFQATTQQSSGKESRKRSVFNGNLAKEYPLKFLIAEDNAINRNVAVASLTKLGYGKDDITLAFDGVEAVRQYEASLSKPPHERYTAILMDIWMPNMDGYEATAAISDLARRHGQTTTIFAVTADITSDCVERAKGAGMQRFLAKPYKVFDIERLITEHFSAAPKAA
ncbi:hypothetical protein BP6252_05127 [Coleophoma cylindrospora]|uniref:histidine kinase n=1 Tax=Coleophoma cylindrospora TaxID=1849047 RepID=A0A3D8RT81_9HELO|nr:hypothetical protein BP6252_05127 [Coleophoma cylindrospora]